MKRGRGCQGDLQALKEAKAIISPIVPNITIVSRPFFVWTHCLTPSEWIYQAITLHKTSTYTKKYKVTIFTTILQKTFPGSHDTQMMSNSHTQNKELVGKKLWWYNQLAMKKLVCFYLFFFELVWYLEIGKNLASSLQAWVQAPYGIHAPVSNFILVADWTTMWTETKLEMSLWALQKLGHKDIMSCWPNTNANRY